MSNFQQNYKISEETGKYTIYTGKKKNSQQKMSQIWKFVSYVFEMETFYGK